MKSVAHHASSLASILHRLSGLKPLKQVHTHIITLGRANNVFLANRLMNCYASFGLVSTAEHIFRRIEHKNVVSWTILISAFTKYELYMKAFEVFSEMKTSGFLPNEVTITSVLPAVANLGLTQIGKSLHCFLLRCHLDVNVFVETSLVYMYSRLGCINTAQKLFDRMPNRNVVSWNALISGYSHNGFGEEVLYLFKLMQTNGVLGDCMTTMSLISGCSIIRCLQLGTAIHGYTIKVGSENDLLVKTALIDMYVKCRCIEYAYRVFSETPTKDVVTWTMMLSSFSDFGYWSKALEIFNEMMYRCIAPLDSVALMVILSSCSKSGALQHGKRIHALTIKTGFGADTFVGSALIDMYANCGDLENARNVFEGLKERDIACWNAMISGSGMNGYGDDAVNLFLQMKGSGIEPANSTLLCVLCACSHSGMVDQGLRIFNCMVNDWCIKPNLQHYACVVDLLSRAGQLKDAYSLINDMPLQPDSHVYGTMLGACRVHGNMDLGLQISQKLFELDPEEAGYYMLLSNMHATAGNWEAAMTTRISLRSKGLKKTPGFSLLERDREIHAFTAGDTDHPHYPEIYFMLQGLTTMIEAEGYMPYPNCLFQDLPCRLGDNFPV